MDAAILANSDLVVECNPSHGFVISRIVDRREGQNLLWNPPRASLAGLTADLGPPGERSIASFDDGILAGGWFTMFPNSGLPGTAQALWMHGEAARIPWTCVSKSATTVVCVVETPASHFYLTRRVSIDGPRVTVSTSAVNRLGRPQLVTFGEHPCFARPLFAGGLLSVGPNARGYIPSVAQPDAARYRGETAFVWPRVPLVDGGFEDAAKIPVRPDGRHDHVVVDGTGGVVSIELPRSPSKITLKFDPATFPHVLFWQHYLPKASPWPGDVFAIEPGTSPGRTFDEALAAGACQTVDVGASVRYWMSLSLQDL